MTPFIPDTAPFSKEQRAWLNGYLAGLYGSDTKSNSEALIEKIPVTVAYGSQTGTAEGLAKKAVKVLKQASLDVTLREMSSCSLPDLASSKNLILITSTYGEGEPPDNAQSLHSSLMAEDACTMEGLNYLVFGLGDSAYPDFCKCSKEFDLKLEGLGAKRLLPAVECDGDPDEKYESWIQEVTSLLSGSREVPLDSVSDADKEASVYTKKNPFNARVLNSLNLNRTGSSKCTHHVEISLEGSGLEYQVGDALGVFPENGNDLIEELILVTGFDSDEPTPLPDKSEVPFYLAVKETYDLASLDKEFLKACYRVSFNEEIKVILNDPEQLSAYLSGRGIIDPIIDFGVRFPTTSYFVAGLKALKPRLYSISSSPLAHPNQVHLTVGKVEYKTHGRVRKGVCSNFLADHDCRGTVKVFVHQNNSFRLPADDTNPVIMIGPGTGIAPFRAFLEEREQGKAAGKNWLIFGDQHIATDFLYEEQIANWLKTGVLESLDTAFSRDQSEKIYVQDKIKENAEVFFEWLESGAYIYVCGDASRMAKDVDAAIHEVIEKAGKLSPEQSKEYVDTLKRNKRYLRDVY